MKSVASDSYFHFIYYDMLDRICFICLSCYCSYCRYTVSNTGCVSVSTVRYNIPLTVPQGISSFPLFYSRPQHHHSCCRCRKQCSSEQPGRQVWSCSRGLSNSGPGHGIWETSKILTNTQTISKSALCAQPSMVLQDIWRRGRVGGRLQGGGVY